jgi:uncharacterized membrane protein (DUF4010 family)
MPEIHPDFVDLLVALGLGLLVGLQRESRKKREAGLRTFALVTLTGAVTAQLAEVIGPWLVPASLIGVAALAAASYYATASRDGDAGLTTEVALVAMFLVGVFVVAGDQRIAVVLGGGIAVLLQAKQRFKWVMEKLGEEDVRAIMLFALLSLVILPILPDEPFGPWEVLNLFETWLLVVLIVGINLGGYILYKFLGQRAGTLLGGVLGGVISSTATTLSYGRRSRDSEKAAQPAAVVIMIATAVVLIRVLIEIGVVSRPLLREAFLPLLVLFLVSVTVSIGVWWRARGDEEAMPEQKNPTGLRPALTFAALYVVVLLLVAWVRDGMGTRGLYVVAAVAGLTDVDAITLSTAQLVQHGSLARDDAWRVITLAYVSNLIFKAGIVAFAGSRALLWRVAGMFGVVAVAAGALILWWP